VDNKGNFIFINHTAEKRFGIKADDCAGFSAFDFIHPDDKEKTVQAFAEWGEKKLTSHVYENRMIDFAGKTRFITWSFNIHYETDGTIKHLNSIAKDITVLKQIQMDLNNELQARKQVEEQRETLLGDLVRANSELKDFSYTVSHDLKAPLRGISSIAKWLSEDYSESLDKKGQEYLDKLLIRTKRMHNLIEGILQYSRVGRTKVEKQQLDSKKNIQEIVDSIMLPKNITITIEESLPIIKYDKILFIQVFQNLIENAVQHLGKPSGEILISCIDQGKNWEFCVKDNGVGCDQGFAFSPKPGFQETPRLSFGAPVHFDA
ncbi:MAG: PAS domain S-box protein, partial [Desulfobacterales bacterium]|nr:PAS domain S-box protein [Desulfobacterales bacterium]